MFNKITIRQHAFTLAETLTVLVILGIIAAMVIPNIFANHKKEETVTRLKKTYSTLCQSTHLAIMDYGPIKTWEVENGRTGEFVNQYLLPYINVEKDCAFSTDGDCYYQVSTLNAPQNKSYFGNIYYKLILIDGTALFFRVIAETVKINHIDIPRAYSEVWIDINGHKGPNVCGKDIFAYYYWIKNDYTPLGQSDGSGKFLPNGGIANDRSYYQTTADCKVGGAGTACAGLIMADNWQIKDDYPWY